MQHNWPQCNSDFSTSHCEIPSQLHQISQLHPFNIWKIENPPCKHFNMGISNFQNATPQQTQNSWEQSLNMFCVAKPGQTFQQWHYFIVSKRFWKFRRSFLGQHIFFHLAFLMSILWMVARVATHMVFVYKNVSLLGQFCYAHSSGKRKMGQKWKLSNDMFGANARLCDVKLKCSPSLGPNFTTTNWFVCVRFSRTPHRRCFIIKHQSFESFGVFSPTVFSEITQIGFLFDQKTSLAAHEWFPLWISPYAAGMDDSNKLASRSNPHFSTEHIWATVGNKYTEFVHVIMQTISHANLLCFVSTTWNLHARTCAWVE